MAMEQAHPAEPKPECHFSRKDIAQVRDGFEKLAQRLDTLWAKKDLSESEQREIDLILNNAMILDEIARGETPEELRGQ